MAPEETLRFRRTALSAVPKEPETARLPTSTGLFPRQPLAVVDADETQRTLYVVPSPDETARLPISSSSPIVTEEIEAAPATRSSAPPPNADPEWTREILETPFVARIRSTLAALWFMIRAPRDFGDAWSLGKGNLPNPALALTAAVSFITLIEHELKKALAPKSDPQTFLTSLGETLGPYILYIGIGLFAHVCLRLLGSKRRLRTTIGISLLAGAGPGSVVAIGLVMPTLVCLAHFGSLGQAANALPQWAKIALLFYILGIYFYSFALFQLALAGAHGQSRWKGVVAGTLAIIAMGFVCGGLEGTSAARAVNLDLGPHLVLATSSKGLDPTSARPVRFAFTWLGVLDRR